MKLLLDACVWPGAASELAKHGHDVVWAGDWPTGPGDDEILAFAVTENRIVVTLDKDFGELAVVFGHAHSGIIRLVNFQISSTRQCVLAQSNDTARSLPTEQSSPPNPEDCVCDRRNPM